MSSWNPCIPTFQECRAPGFPDSLLGPAQTDPRSSDPRWTGLSPGPDSDRGGSSGGLWAEPGDAAWVATCVHFSHPPHTHTSCVCRMV